MPARSERKPPRYDACARLLYEVLFELSQETSAGTPLVSEGLLALLLIPNPSVFGAVLFPHCANRLRYSNVF